MLYTGKKPKHVTLNLVLRSKSVLCRLCTDKHKSDNRRHFLGGFTGICPPNLSSRSGPSGFSLVFNLWF